MPLFVVTFDHPNEAGWLRRVRAHVGYLNHLLARGVLRDPIFGALSADSGRAV